MAEEKKSGFRLHALNPMVLLGIIMFLAFLASYIVPAGEYSRVLNPVLNKEVVDPATFHYIQQQPVSPFYLFQSLTLGLQNAAEIISCSSSGACLPLWMPPEPSTPGCPTWWKR